MSYRVRPATLDDLDVLVHQRLAMFTDMGVPIDEQAIAPAFARWLGETMPAHGYRAWLVETGSGEVVAGGGATIIPWPPGPEHAGSRLAFVYNVYTEPAHRRRGLGRLVMEAIHEWCRSAGIAVVALNASRAGQPLYESMGYSAMSNPMMVFSVVRV
jgi:GNAT superfamily N-acetyltransferase